MAAQLFSDEVVKFSFTVKDVPKEPVNSKKSPLSHISPSRKKDSGKLGIGGASSSKKNIGGIGKASIRSPVKNNNNNNANKNDNDKKNRKSKKTLIANPSVDFGSMTALLNKDNPNVVSFSNFQPPEEVEEEIANKEHFLSRKPKVVEEEPSLEPAAILAPSQRQQYFERPAIRGRIRFTDYQNHRVMYGGRTRPKTAQSWNSSTQYDRPDDFRKDMETVNPHRIRPRSTRRRRELTGKAIHAYNECVARPAMSKKQMKQPWNRKTKTANFKSALESQKGRRIRYAYGTTVKVYKGVAYTLDEDEQLGMLFDGQVGRNGKSPKRIMMKAGADSLKKSAKNIKSKTNLASTNNSINVKERNVIDEANERIGNKTFRLLPYESARKEWKHVPRAGFVMDRKKSYDRIKVLKKVNLGGRRKKKRSNSGNRRKRETADERRARKDQIIGKNRLNAS